MLYPAELWVRCPKAAFSAAFGYISADVMSSQSGTKRKNAAHCGTLLAHFAAHCFKRCDYV